MTDLTEPSRRLAGHSYDVGWQEGYHAGRIDGRDVPGDTLNADVLRLIGERLDEYRDGWRELGHPPYPSDLVDDLQALLDAQVTNHD